MERKNQPVSVPSNRQKNHDCCYYGGFLLDKALSYEKESSLIR
jgi:hypothetical protein